MNEYLYLVSEMQKLIDSKSNFVINGSCKSFDDYRHVSGEIRGLALAIDIIKDREQKVEGLDE